MEARISTPPDFSLHSFVPYRNDEIVFHFDTTKEFIPLLDWSIENCRKCFPGARIVVVADGDDGPEYLALIAKHHIELWRDEHLFKAGMAGRLWTRRFKSFQANPGKWFFRCDADVGFYRPFFQGLPGTDCLFGTLKGNREDVGGPFAQGGFMGLTRGAFEEIMNSRLLEGPLGTELNHEYTPGRLTASDDQAIAGAAYALGIKAIEHPEISSEWRDFERKPNSDFRYAVVHPCKNGKL